MKASKWDDTGQLEVQKFLALSDYFCVSSFNQVRKEVAIHSRKNRLLKC